MTEYYGERLKERYGIEELPADSENPNEVIEVMETIGRKRGAIISGGRVDLDKTSLLFLRELRSGKLGRVSLEVPEEYL